MLRTQQWRVTLREKANVLSYLKQQVGQVQQPHLQLLPRNKEECPEEVMTRAFGTETPIECQVDYADLLLRARDWPMRSTHRYAQATAAKGVAASSSASAPGPELMQHMGSFVAGLLQGQVPKAPGQEASLPGFKLLGHSSSNVGTTPPAVSVLALEDKKEDDAVLPAVLVETVPTAETVGKMESAPTGKMAVSATLSALQQEVSTQPTETTTQQRGVKKAALKKPAAKGMKRPAAAAPVVLRRPAAARATMDAPESRDARRVRLIQSRVPKAVQDQFRDGCSKCYYRKGCTLSCWTMRGFDMTD
eukprot:s636_g47.t2